MKYAYSYQCQGKPEDMSERKLHLDHCDHRGLPLALIDETGAIAWQAEYDEWGNPLSEDNPQDLQQLIRLPGQQLDDETGLYYNRHRYYDPQQGRYITQDPIGLAGGWNLYSYPQNPIQYVDPLGLEGTMTIYSSGDGGSSMMSGHSWISYQPDGGNMATYGTWGNNPTGKENGLFE